MKRTLYITSFILVLALIFSFHTSENSIFGEKITGANFEAPPKKISKNNLLSLDRIAAEWIGITPYAYTPRNSASVIFHDNNAHWWGEGISGAVEQIKYAKSLGFKVMLKPHVWVLGDGWAGDFELTTEDKWKEWERDYKSYLMALTEVAEKHKVDLFCIGTEYRKAVIQRPEFWFELVAEIRTKYSGKLTYAANWDNYQNVSFWNSLDFIGVNAYFPLSDKKTPDIEELNSNWTQRREELSKFSRTKNRLILFTEYGYRSSDYCAKSPWEEANKQVNIEGQRNAYESLFHSTWNEDWMAGGFLWKWHAIDEKSGGRANAQFTPQNKPAEAVIRRHYCR